MAYTYTSIGGKGDFTVTKSNPSGNVVRFTVSDSANKLTNDPKMLRAVLNDAIAQWITAERADLDTNGDGTVVGATDYHPGDGFSAFTYDFDNKYAEVTLTALTSISSTGDLTVSIPYADVA